jgi:hypothetical protein
MSVQDQIERLLRPTYSGDFLRGLDIVRQMIVHGTAPAEPDRVTDEFLRGLQHAHTLVEQWKDTERVLMAIDEICLIAWLERTGGGR